MGVRLTDKDCPICEEGKLMDIVEGTDDCLETFYSLCDSCGTEIADAEQMRMNKESKLKCDAEANKNEPERET